MSPPFKKLHKFFKPLNPSWLQVYLKYWTALNIVLWCHIIQAVDDSCRGQWNQEKFQKIWYLLNGFSTGCELWKKAPPHMVKSNHWSSFLYISCIICLALRTFVMFGNFDLEMSLVCKTKAELKERREVGNLVLLLAAKAIQILPSCEILSCAFAIL